MDPDEVLTTLRELTLKVLEEGAEVGGGDGDAINLAMSFAAMDMWLTMGGFLPKDWMSGGVCPECGRTASDGHKMDCSVGRL